MLIHPDSVEDAIEELEFQFERPALLVANRKQKLTKTRPLVEDDFDGFTAYSCAIRNMTTLFAVAGLEHQNSDALLLEDAVSKLPMSRTLDWAAYVGRLGVWPTL